MKTWRIEKEDSVTTLRTALEKSCYCTRTLIQFNIAQRCTRREAVLEEVIGDVVGLIDGTPAGEIDQASHLSEFVGQSSRVVD